MKHCFNISGVRCSFSHPSTCRMFYALMDMSHPDPSPVRLSASSSQTLSVSFDSFQSIRWTTSGKSMRQSLAIRLRRRCERFGDPPSMTQKPSKTLQGPSEVKGPEDFRSTHSLHIRPRPHGDCEGVRTGRLDLNQQKTGWTHRGLFIKWPPSPSPSVRFKKRPPHRCSRLEP